MNASKEERLKALYAERDAVYARYLAELDYFYARIRAIEGEP